MARITALNIYPVKSCRGIALERATLAATGFIHDRQWMIVRPNGRFITQREEPRLALIEPSLGNAVLTLQMPNAAALTVPMDANAGALEVQVWDDKCVAFDAGDAAAAWLEGILGKPYRLVRFDPAHKRPSSAKYTGDIEALNQFSDGFAYLVISQGSLDDLNTRLPQPLPMNRFRPNIVLDGVPPYAEDTATEFFSDGVRLRSAKLCARCVITTTDQSRGERDGDEPLKTLRSYRFNRESRGIMFGQNVILAEGAGRELRVGDELDIT